MSKSFKTPQQVLYVCNGSKCKKRGGKELGKLFRDQVKAAGLRDQVEVIKTDCTDRCKSGPIMSLQPQNLWLYETTEQQVLQLFREKVLGQQEETKKSSDPEV